MLKPSKTAQIKPTKGKKASKEAAAKPVKGKKEKPVKEAPVKAKKAAPKSKAAPKAKAAPKPKTVKPKRSISSATAPLTTIRRKADPSDNLKVTDLAGILPPVGLFDPLNLAGQATPDLLRKYREAELTHGRIAMVASVGFLVGEGVQGFTPLFDGEVKGAGILQIAQVPAGFWVSFLVGAFAIETTRTMRMIEDPTTAPPEKFGRYRQDWVAGDLGFDPLGLKPFNAEDFKSKQTKELQNGRLAMLATSGFLAQELTDKKGIVEHVVSGLPPLPDLPFSLPF